MDRWTWEMLDGLEHVDLKVFDVPPVIISMRMLLTSRVLRKQTRRQWAGMKRIKERAQAAENNHVSKSNPRSSEGDTQHFTEAVLLWKTVPYSFLNLKRKLSSVWPIDHLQENHLNDC
jgi:hypothetical protein